MAQPTLQELHREHGEVWARRKELVLISSGPNARQLTPEENAEFIQTMNDANYLSKRISEREAQNTIRNMIGPDGIPKWLHDPHGPPRRAVDTRQKPMSTEYTEAFLSFLRSGGKHTSSALSEGFDPLFGGFTLPTLRAALYEGSESAGGDLVSVPTVRQVVPFGLPDIGVRSIASVIATATDVKIPSQSSFSTAGIKAESGGSSNAFTESNPALSQFTLSAYMIGLTHTCSWELLQDVELLQQFAITDLLAAIDIAEDGFFVTGTGSDQPQGLIGNVGTGTGSAYAVESTGQYLLDAVTDVQGTLKATYFRNASWLMNRATSTSIRKAQQQSNLFNPLWVREGGRDLLLGFPVTYSEDMPDIPSATSDGVTPVLFGSFTDGYVIGDRGGSGTFVKVLDQPNATLGQTILLAYKRVDGRVRRSEAIQGISISHS